MRHRKHNHQLGVKTAHRASLLANLCCALIENGRIKTTLAKAKALRPTIEKIVTLAKKSQSTDDLSQKVHFRRLAIARLRNKKAVQKLFDELVNQFLTRNGGYTRIYKLAHPRLGDAAEMALIEFVEEAPKKKPKRKKSSSKKKQAEEATAEEATAEEATAEEATSKQNENVSETVSEETVEPEDSTVEGSGKQNKEQKD